MASKHSAGDQAFLDGLPGRKLIEFRNYMFTPSYITLNAGRFLDHEWIDIPALREFLGNSAPEAGSDASSTRSTRLSACPDLVRIKTEGADPLPLSAPPTSFKIRTSYEGGREVLEISSDSESDADEISGDLTRGASRSSSVYHPPDDNGTPDSDDEFPTVVSAPSVELIESDDESHASEVSKNKDVNDFDCDYDADEHGGSNDSDDDSGLFESDTLWQDPIKSYVRIGNFQITKKNKSFKRIEYVDELPSVYPQFPERTAIVVDLRDPKFNIKKPNSDELYTVDHLIRNADNDSYRNDGSGAGSSTALVTFVPGEAAIECRRASGRCKGAFACERIDRKLINIIRYELDPAPRDAILSAQADTRRNDGTTPEQNAAIFKEVVCNSKCTAIDSDGNVCKGAPMMKPKAKGGDRGHQYFIACSGWTPKFQKNHRTHTIPDHVDENLLAKAFACQPLSTDHDTDTQPCSRLVHPSTGLKAKFCPHAHIVDGKQVKSRILQYPCPARRSIYVPIDPTYRKALIVQNNTGHNHPMPPLTKASIAPKETYAKCVESSGIVGSTVAKVDNAPSTKLILNGKTPSLFSPALGSKRVKQEIVRSVKAKKYPNGLGLTGAFDLYMNHLTKPLPERYIHGYLTLPGGGVCIFTCVVYLLKLLDDPGVTAFDDDTTYKRVEGEMNEWEVTVFVKAVLRAASVVRAYINRASTDFFEQVFDELQRVKLMVTGKPIALKKFVPGGNLLVMNADMDGAQALGICRSVMKHNVPEYSGIPNDTPPEKVAPHFLKICWRHSKEPIHDFKSLVSTADYNRLLDFVYIESKEALDEFSAFVKRLGVKKIQDWWAHKQNNEWIIPCLVKSQSLIPANVWDSTPSTTNTNEAQHHWTNSLTGTKLTLVEALEKAYVVDQNTADEIATAFRTGVLTNPHNEVTHRMARNSQRQSKIAQKARESQEQTTERQELEAQLAEEAEARRQSSARTKDINARLKVVKDASKKGSSSRAGSTPTASSSGRVKTIPAPSRKGSSKSTRAAVENNTPIVDTPVSPPEHPQTTTFNSVESAHTTFGSEVGTINLPIDSSRPTDLEICVRNCLEPELSAPILSTNWEGMFMPGPVVDMMQLDVPEMPQSSYDRIPSEFLDPQVYSGALPLLPDLADPSATPDTLMYDLNDLQLGTLFGLGSDFSANIPVATPYGFSFSTTPQYSFSENPLAALNSFLPSAASPLPLLPPPPPDSPPESAPSREELCSNSVTSKSKRAPRSKLDGLEPANILATGSARTRAPSSRKRDAEQEVSEQPSKKRKKNKP
ncbi:hypothetical protein B0H11DRAFT_2279492 [Mycena galericulata]|nr:hypothetical protein B0H11DRAFT_2279492 [Mycena galericulata]